MEKFFWDRGKIAFKTWRSNWRTVQSRRDHAL